ncbi:MAG: TonB-dependent receptor, partial [Desulfobacterales bacterium]|nr:TonB-dependent receptor [Desulfobacterales bacterium]
YDGEVFGLTTGVDWLKYDITSTYAPQSSTYTNAAGFALGKMKLMDKKWVLLAGGRFDYYDVEIHKGQGSDEDDADFNPSLGVVYNASKTLKFRASAAEAFRMPSAAELAGDFNVEKDGKYKGNPNLKPEKSQTFELGVDYTPGNLKTQLTLFTTQYDNKITSDPKQGYTTYKNLDEATTRGVEGEVSYAFADILGVWELRPYVKATWLFKAEDAATGEDLKYNSDLNLSGGVALTDLDGFSADLSASHQSRQDVYKWNPDYTRSEATLPSVTVVNFTMSKRILECDGLGSLSLKGEVKNLFDEDAAYVLGYPIAGRRFFAGVSWAY